MEDDILNLCMIKFGEEIDAISIVLPYIMGEYYMKSQNVSRVTQLESIGRILVNLSTDKLKMSIFVATELETHINILEEMEKRISFAKKIKKF